jgi:hypothetical protein
MIEIDKDAQDLIKEKMQDNLVLRVFFGGFG